jgi:hypothetical protein
MCFTPQSLQLIIITPLLHSLPVLPPRDIALFPLYNSTLMRHIQHHKSEQHRERVEIILVNFVIGDRAR